MTEDVDPTRRAEQVALGYFRDDRPGAGAMAPQAALAARLERVARDVVDRRVDAIEGAATAWRIALAAAGNTNQSVRAWFSRTADLESHFHTPPAYLDLVRVGRECVALPAMEWVDDDPESRRARLAEAATRAAAAATK